MFQLSGAYGICAYLHPKSMLNKNPKHLELAQKAISLHTFGLQVPSSRSNLARACRC